MNRVRVATCQLQVRETHENMQANEPTQPVIAGWRQVCSRLCSRETWITAFKMLLLVVRNAVGSIVGAWTSSAFCSLGNVFSGKWYTEQSRNELMVANSVWTALTFCTCVLTSNLFGMVTMRFLRSPNAPPTVCFCLKRLVRATGVYFAATVIIIFSFSCFIVYLVSIDPGVFEYKADSYVIAAVMMGYITGVSRAMSRIYYEETCQGRDRLQYKQQSANHRVSPDGVSLGQDSSSAALPRFQQPTFWRAFIKTLPVTSPPFLAGIFVHTLSRQRIVDRTNVVLGIFVLASTGFKLGVQELTKHFIFKKRVRSALVMSMLVGIPTVLIDTQTRIILLGTNSATTATMGAIGMAVVEIGLRSGKAALLLWEIRRRKASIERRSTNSDRISRRSTTGIVPQPSRLEESMSSRVDQFEVWRRQMQTFHVAELNADMYAEYISIGCSASILFFYGNHPHYAMLRQSGDSDVTSIDSVEWRISQLGMLTLQMGIEVVVDFVSIVIEVAIGIEFTYAKKLGPFLAGVFMVAAVMNSNISIDFYLS